MPAPASVFGSASGFKGFGNAASTGVAAATDPKTSLALAAGGRGEPADPAPVDNGEEGEECLFEVRARLYRWDKEGDGAGAGGGGAADEAAEASVPASRASAFGNGTENGDGTENGEKEGGKEGEAAKGASGGGGDASSSAAPGPAPAPAPAAYAFREAGTGPLRILRRKANGGEAGASSRIVHRQETSKMGKGTRLILNLAIPKGFCKVQRTGAQYVKMTTVEQARDEGGPGGEDGGEGAAKAGGAGEEKKDEPALTRYLIRVNPKNQAELERMLVKAGAEAIAPNDDDD